MKVEVCTVRRRCLTSIILWKLRSCLRGTFSGEADGDHLPSDDMGKGMVPGTLATLGVYKVCCGHWAPQRRAAHLDHDRRATSSGTMREAIPLDFQIGRT